MNTRYVKLEWPRYQRYMDRDWWSEDVFVCDDDGTSIAFIPASRLESRDSAYVVSRLEVHKQPVAVSDDEADSARDAVEIVREGGGEIVPAAHTYHSDLSDYATAYWDVEHDGTLIDSFNPNTLSS